MYNQLTTVIDSGGRSARPGSFSPIRKVALLLLIGVCVMGSSCENAPTIWKAEAQSPDRLWVASVRTQQHGGFGSAGIVNSVYLKKANGSKYPMEILELFSDGRAPVRPYVLDNANVGGTISLTMKWIAPSHLEVTYAGPAEISVQVAKYDGIDISVRDVSPGQTTASH
jgi:hypothetical protein